MYHEKITLTPGTQNIALGKSAQFSLIRRIPVDSNDTVFSNGTLAYSQNTLRVDAKLSKAAIGPDLISIVETITIPSHLIYNAYHNGARKITYTRTFIEISECKPNTAPPAKFIIFGSSLAVNWSKCHTLPSGSILNALVKSSKCIPKQYYLIAI